MSRNPVFEPELIEEHEKAYEAVKEDVYLLAGADNKGSIVMVAGYHDDEYEYAQYAQFGTSEDAYYAHIAISNYHHALNEIKRLREEYEVLKRVAERDRLIVNMFITKWEEDKPNV